MPAKLTTVFILLTYIEQHGIKMEKKTKIKVREANDSQEDNYLTRYKLNEEFFKAVENENIEAVKDTLARGADIHANEHGPDEIPTSYALRIAVTKGNVEITKFLLNNGADIHAGEDRAFVIATYLGHIETVKLLIDRGSDIHSNNNQAIKDSASGGHINIVKLLIEKGVNFRHEDDMALRRAAYSGKANIVKLLLSKGADVHASNDCALRWATNGGDGKGQHTDTVRILLEHGANMYSDHDSPLKCAAQNERIEIVSLMIVDFNMKVKPETKAYLQDNNCEDALKILNSRDLSNKISSSLKPKNEKPTQSKKMKL